MARRQPKKGDIADKRIYEEDAEKIYGKGRSSLQFKIKDKSGKFWFYVLVYDNIRILRKDMELYRITLGRPHEQDDDKALAVHHAYQRFKVDPKTEAMLDEYSGYDIGIIRLAKGHVNIETVSHEVTHAALHQYRCENKGKANFKRACYDEEEDLAYLIGRLMRDITRKLMKFGIVK